MYSIYTLWLFNIAMEKGPFFIGKPGKPSINGPFSMAMLNNQRIYIYIYIYLFIYIYLDLMSVGSRFVEVNPPDEGQKSVTKRLVPSTNGLLL